MSYINRRSRDSSWRRMVVRRQVSDVLSYGYIVTTKARAKLTQRCLEKVITLSKVDSLVNKREASSVILRTTKHTKDELMDRLFGEISEKYRDRSGGYSRVLRTKDENRAILSLV